MLDARGNVKNTFLMSKAAFGFEMTANAYFEGSTGILSAFSPFLVRARDFNIYFFTPSLVTVSIYFVHCLVPLGPLMMSHL